jgi:hypothetical protein
VQLAALVASGRRARAAALRNERRNEIARNAARKGGRQNLIMTINVALVTSEALVFGCDSTASMSGYFLNPFGKGLQLDKNGKPAHDADGCYSIKFKYEQLDNIVTDAWGGVTKMFHLADGPCQVAGVTAGLASLSQRPIALIAEEFCSHHKRKPTLKTVDAVAKAFLKFMRSEFENHYKNSKIPVPLREAPEFLLGGYGPNDKFPSLFRVNVRDNKLVNEFRGGGTGIAWNAQSDVVERVLRGYDRQLRSAVDDQLQKGIKTYTDEMNKAVLDIISRILSKLKQPMPKGVKTTLPTVNPLTLPWDSLRLDVGYGNLPLQEAVHFASYLVLMQSGRYRFAKGVATVGGRTHVGVITKDKGFRKLNEPELAHKWTGFADD